MSHKLLRHISLNKCCARFYVVEPPEWLGGKDILNKAGKHRFPGYTKRFEERINEIKNSIERINSIKNLGLEAPSPLITDKKELIKISTKNSKNQELERQSRLLTLMVPLEEVEINDKINHIYNIANHYGIFRDVFNTDFFYPIVHLKIGFKFEEEIVTPVYYGNRIVPSEAKDSPIFIFDNSNVENIYSLIFISPDSNPFHHNKEMIHWMVTNINTADLNSGTEIIKYLQPIPLLGTGYHRMIFLLFQHKNCQSLNFEHFQLKDSTSLEERSFLTSDFLKQMEDEIFPVGLAFFQSCWDLSVREIFYKKFSMEEPRYKYKHPVPYHPPPIKYPHRQPFDKYFDRYRDRKDLAEEVLKIKLSNSIVINDLSKQISTVDCLDPFVHNNCQYPLVHRRGSRPTWLKQKENYMFRKLGQFKHLNNY